MQTQFSKQFFKEDGHYLGKPAESTNKIIQRRLNLVDTISEFKGAQLSLLDIGCGAGASLIRLAPDMKHCLGIDINDYHSAEFEKLCEESQLSNCDFKVMNIEQEHIQNQFDRIICFEVIEHFADENKGVSAIYNALRSGGIAAISVPNKWWIFETHGAKLPLLPWNRIPFFSWLPKPIHERFSNARIYTRKRIVKLLEKHGFTVVKTNYIMAPMDILQNGKLKNFLQNRVFRKDVTKNPMKSTSIFVVVKK
ncbi:MAG: class I SAM-dependent methyltransferase [Bacteroidales bacterium]|nr:class I SAM-dependent methyltransferase [Bacteroidales bacterium]